MGWLSRAAQSTRAYPAAGTSVTGRADRFRLARTTGARRADRAGQDWDAKDRDAERNRSGRYSR